MGILIFISILNVSINNYHALFRCHRAKQKDKSKLKQPVPSSINRHYGKPLEN